MRSFTGYEPNNVPTTLSPAGTLPMQAGSASTPAAGQIVQAENLETDLGNLMDHSMISVEEFIEDSIAPIGSGEKSFASILPISGGVKTYASIDTRVVPSQSGGNPLPEKSSSSGANPMAEENSHLDKNWALPVFN